MTKQSPKNVVHGYPLDTLKKYAAGQLDSETTKEISQKADDDEHLANILAGVDYLHARSKERGKSVEQLLAQSLQKQEGLISEHFKRHRERRRAMPRLAAAAFVIMGFLGLWAYNNPLGIGQGPVQIAAQHLATPYPLRSTHTRATIQQAAPWQVAYNTGQWEQVAELLTGTTPLTEETQYYLGLAYLFDGKPSQAVPYLKNVEAFGNLQGYEENARWYLALAYLSMDKPWAAGPLLDQIAQNQEGHYQQSQAKILIKQLQ